MPAIPSELLFPNAWLRQKRVLVVTNPSGEEGMVRLSSSKGGRVKIRYEGPADEAAGRIPQKTWMVTALPLQRSLSRQLHPPVASVRTAATLLDGMLDTEIPFPVDQARYGFPEIVKTTSADPDKKIRGLAIAARTQDLDTHLAPLQAAGLDPQLVDHEGLALWTQSFHERRAKADGRARAIAHGEAQRTVLVFGRGSRFLNAQVLTLPATDPAFAERLDRALRAQFPGDEAIDWRLSGSAPEHAGQFAGTPSPDRKANQVTAHKRPTTFLERALGRRALKAGPLRFNFRPDHPELVRSRSRRNTGTALHLLIPGLLLWAFALGWGQFMKNRDAAVQAELSQTANAITGFKVPKGQELLEVERALAGAAVTGDQAGANSPLQRLARPRADQQLRHALQFARRNNMHLETLSFNGDKLVLTGANVLPLERKLPEIGAFNPDLKEADGRFTLTLSLP